MTVKLRRYLPQNRGRGSLIYGDVSLLVGEGRNQSEALRGRIL